MLNKDKRGKLLSFILGDGCLHRSSPAQPNKTGYISIKHGWKQKDYIEWKAAVIAEITERPVKVHAAKSHVKALNKTYDQFKLQIGMKRMRAWRKFCYPSEKKSLTRLLKFITDPIFALTLWLCDDGTVMTGRVHRNDPKSVRVCSGLILYLGDVSKEDAWAAYEWFSTNFNIKPRIHWQAVKYKGVVRYYPDLRFKVQDALKIWALIKHYVFEIPSMTAKFKKLDDRANRSDLLQPQPALPLKT